MLHYWSLAVEEQFYLVWPVLLLLARRWAGAMVALVGIASFAACVVVTASMLPTAYFLLPTRAWELAAGAGLALAAPRINRRAAVPCAWIGIVAIGWSAAAFGEGTAFPGTAALLPVLGTVAVLYAGGHGPARVLTARPLQQVGRWSYAWYLWHWPVLVLAAAAVGRTLSTVENLALAATSFWLAAGTHYVIENPIRFRPRVPAFRVGAALTALSLLMPVVAAGRLPSLEGTGVAAAAPVFLATEPTVTTTSMPATTSTTSTTVGLRPSTTARRQKTTTTTTAAPPRVLSPLEQALQATEVPSNLTPPLSQAPKDKPRIYREGCHRPVESTSADGCVYGVPDGEKTIVLFGDSHAAHWFPALERLATTRHWRLVSMTKSACPPIDAPVQQSHRRYTECETWHERVRERIASEQADIVVMSMLRTYGRSGHTPGGKEWHAAVARMATKLQATGARVVVFGATPSELGNVPACLSEHMRDIQACVKPKAEVFDRANADGEAAAVRKAGATYAPLIDWLCLDRCPTIIGNLLVYRDTSHLTTTFSTSLAEAVGTVLTL